MAFLRPASSRAQSGFGSPPPVYDHKGNLVSPFSRDYQSILQSQTQRQQAAQTAPNPSGFTGDASSFLESLYTSRPKFVQQQQDLLSQFGPSSRQAIFAASPE